MHGFGDEFTTGERIARYRVRRGMTQAVLANLVGRTEDWLSKIERGEREVHRVDVLVELAHALRVTLGDLIGEPVLAEDDRHDDDVPAVREALMSPRQLSRTLFRSASAAPPGLDAAQRLTTYAWDDYQAGRMGRVTAALPGLILTAQALEDSADGADDERARFALSARIHHLATTTLMKFGETDLAWIAAERAVRAGDASGDALALGSAARAGTHALLGLGRYAEAIQLGTTAVEWMREQIDAADDVALSLAGMLHLRLAVAAARRGDRAAASEFLDQATLAAQRLGRDANLWHTGFGPTNVMLHRMAVALDFGDIAFLVDRGPAVQADHLPVERVASFKVDLARGLSLAARDSDALEALLSAEKASAGIVRHSAVARETVREMYRRDRRHTSALSELADRCRVVA